MMRKQTSSLLTVTLALCCGIACRAGSAAPAPANCAAEAAALAKDESELPRLDVASPNDRPPYCITLETIMTFASRVKTHVGRCPASNFATSIAEWERMRTDYGKLFTQTRCKRTLS